MQEYLSLGKIKREKIAEKINKALFKEKEVIFVYVFGSFADSPSFRDIDIGIYVKGAIEEKEIFDYELKLSKLIADKCDLPFDIIETHILNFAPSHFLNNVFCRGNLLFSRDQGLLSDLIENTSLDAIANEYVSKQSIEELISV